jgi:glycine hydroxymethyltransferase
MLTKDMTIAGFDDELEAAMSAEALRQQEHIELIASENYASPRVQEEGYPGKRYYGGCGYVDIVENLAIERAKALFGAGYANVQAHSGSQANSAVFLALLKPGDTLLGMSLADGGHLTHGAAVSSSGRIYNAVQYGLNSETGEIDYEQVEALALQHKPKLVIAGFSAYSRIVDWQRMRDIADKVGAYLMVDMAHVAGLVAAGEYPSPVKIAHVTTSTTHKTLRGPRGGLILTPGDDEELNKRLNFAIFPESQGGPLMHVIAAKAVAFKEAMSDEFKTYQQQVLKNARAMVDVFIERGFDIISGGTDDHLFLLSLVGREVTGKDAEETLGRANITVNKNAVPNDPRSPFVTSGLRLGSPAVTTRGFGEEEVKEMSNWMCDILDDIENEELIQSVKQKVLALCAKFPVYK